MQTVVVAPSGKKHGQLLENNRKGRSRNDGISTPVAAPRLCPEQEGLGSGWNNVVLRGCVMKAQVAATPTPPYPIQSSGPSRRLSASLPRPANASLQDLRCRRWKSNHHLLRSTSRDDSRSPRESSYRGVCRLDSPFSLIGLPPNRESSSTSCLKNSHPVHSRVWQRSQWGQTGEALRLAYWKGDGAQVRREEFLREHDVDICLLNETHAMLSCR